MPAQGTQSPLLYATHFITIWNTYSDIAVHVGDFLPRWSTEEVGGGFTEGEVSSVSNFNFFIWRSIFSLPRQRTGPTSPPRSFQPRPSTTQRSKRSDLHHIYYDLVLLFQFQTSSEENCALSRSGSLQASQLFSTVDFVTHNCWKKSNDPYKIFQYCSKIF